jgi:hypothetical protein
MLLDSSWVTSIYFYLCLKFDVMDGENFGN